jgi:hypothetical protein
MRQQDESLFLQAPRRLTQNVVPQIDLGDRSVLYAVRPTTSDVDPALSVLQAKIGSIARRAMPLYQPSTTMLRAAGGPQRRHQSLDSFSTQRSSGVATVVSPLWPHD